MARIGTEPVFISIFDKRCGFFCSLSLLVNSFAEKLGSQDAVGAHNLHDSGLFIGLVRDWDRHMRS